MKGDRDRSGRKWRTRLGGREERNDSKDDLNTWYCVDIHPDPPSSAPSGMDFENNWVLRYGWYYL